MDASHCKLSINVPTYNRLRYLRHTLDLLAPQIFAGVELNVLDNCSTDGTWGYLEERLPAANRLRQEKNLGVDGNVVSCLNFGRGEYIWTLGDDDVPKPDCVALLLRAIEEHNRPPLIFLRTLWMVDPDFYAANPAGDALWQSVDPNTFMADVSIMFTALSSVVVRRGAVDDAFIRGYVGSVLTPAAIVLYTAFLEGRAVVSGAPLLMCRSDNVGSYDGTTVLTRNLARLLRDFKPRGLRSSVIRRVFVDNLTSVVPYVIRVQPLTASGLRMIVRFCFAYPSSAPRLLGALLVKLGTRVGWTRLAAIWRRGRGRLLLALYRQFRRGLDAGARLEFRRAVTRLGEGNSVEHPVSVHAGDSVEIGQGFRGGPGLRLEIIREHREYRFDPRIQIFDQVVLGANVSLRIATSLTIRSRTRLENGVSISDLHFREDLAYRLVCPPSYRQIVSPGPISIGENVLIKENAFICGGVTIGRDAVIGRGVVLARDVAPGEIVPDAGSAVRQL